MSDATPIEVLANTSPAAAEAFGQLRRAAATEGGLDHAVEHLVAVASLAARGQLGSMLVHARRALGDGVPIDRLRQAVVSTLGAAAIFGEVVAALRALDQLSEAGSSTDPAAPSIDDVFRAPAAPARMVDGPVAATLYAPDQPEAVVLLHSLGMDQRIWAPLVDPLASRLAVLTCDLPGHGRSPVASDATVESMADQVAATVAAAGLSSVAVVGLSLGGSVAQALAAGHQHLVRALALLDTSAWYGNGAPTSWAERAATARDDGMAALTDFQLERWFSDGFRQRRPDVCAAALGLFGATGLDGYTAACTALGAMDLRQAIEAITCPTVVVVGEDDGATPLAHAEDIHRRINGSTLCVLAGCKHLSAVERPGAVLGHVADVIGA